MSVQVTTWVWNHSKTTGSAKLVMLAIADHMNPEGTSAWPSLGRLVRMTGLSLPTVIRSIKTAEELGELVIDRKTGGRPPKGAHASNDYALVMDAETESKSNATLPLDDAKGSRHVTPKSNATLPEPQSNHK